MKYLSTGTGEAIGGIKVASIAAAGYGIWARRAGNAVSKSKKSDSNEKLQMHLQNLTSHGKSGFDVDGNKNDFLCRWQDNTVRQLGDIFF